MKKEIPITPPEGYEIDKERMVFVQKEIDLFPDERSLKLPYRWANPDGEFDQIYFPSADILVSKILAFTKLIELRDEVNRRDGFVVDWRDEFQIKWCVEFHKEKSRCISHSNAQRPFAFRTKEIAQKFAEKYKDLINQCPDLI